MSKFPIDFERIIHSFKTALACSIGFIAIRLFNLPGSQWVVITIIIVMCGQLSVGSLLQKSYFRFLGTFAGCLIAALTIYFIGNSFFIAIVTIGVSSFLFSYIATAKENLIYTGTLGATTTAIIMLTPHADIGLAIERFIEIAIGLIIATIVSQFVLPIHSRTHLKKSQSFTLQQLRELYIEMVINRHQKRSLETEHEMDEEVAKTLLKQRQLAKESVKEPLGIVFSPSRFTKTLYYEKEILRAINFMHLALIKHPEADDFIAGIAFHDFNQSVLKMFNDLIKALEGNLIKEIKEIQYTQFKNALLIKIKENIETVSIPLAGFLFSAEILIMSLGKLAELYNISKV